MRQSLLFFGPEYLRLKHFIENGIRGEAVIIGSCGYLYSCLVTESQTTYLIFSSLFGNEDIKLLQVPEGNHVNSFCCCLDEMFIVTSKGFCFRYCQETGFQCVYKGSLVNKVLDLAVGTHYRLLLMNDGTLQSITPSSKLEPFILPWLIKEVSCGKEHVLLLTNDNLVLTFGAGSRGQLGHGDLKGVEKPQPVEALEGLELTTINAGGWHSAAISISGDVYVWGWNESCQLGFPCIGPDGVSCQALPTLLEVKEPDISKNSPPVVEFKDISCGARHTVAVDDKGRVFGWGWNGYGQLSPDKSIVVISNPTLICPEHVVTHITCNAWSTLLKISP